ncbi:T9SS type A sorting domain-containing protein [Flavobacterium ardleyense]|uniref:T9SS type A sorting domain-containing protein n=1 Tax=Flavobacterium ardleyense TaxID=2038737 RepID=A0ABW5ZB65_9FLAO
MKKITLLFTFLIAFGYSSYAQVSAYTFTQSAGMYTENSSGATILADVMADSFISDAQPIGFSFNYEGVDYTQFKMSSNGAISFNMAGTSNLTGNSFSDANTASRPIIAPLWDDLDGRSTGSVASYEVTGTAPNQVLTIEWRNWEWNYNSGATPVISFQVKLYQTTNVIEFVYRSEAGTVNLGSASIGIGSASGSGAGSYLNLTSITTPAVSSTTSTTNINTKPATGQIYKFSPPSCLAPGNIVATNITTNGADLSWSHPSMFDFEYVVQPVGTGVPSGSGTPVGDVSESIVGTLSAGTNYEIYIRTDCGSGEFSGWAGPVNFRTLCLPNTIPYFEGFEVGYVQGASITGCLSQQSIGGTGVWSANTSLTDYNRTPRTGSWNSFLGYSNEDWIFIPINLVGGTNYTVKTYARQDGSGGTNANLSISYGTINTATGMTNSIVAATPLINGGYQKISGAFTPATTGTYYVGIKGSINTAPWYISLDDISIDVTSSCAEPTALVASNISTTGVDLAWNHATALDFEYVVQVAGTGLPSGAGTSVGATTASILGTLTPATNYEFYVRADCGSGELSGWNGPSTFTTACTSVTSFNQGFEGTTGALFPTCWTKVGTAGTAYTQTSTAITGARNLYIYSTGASSRPVVSMITVSNANAGTHRMAMKVRANFSVGETVELGYLTNPADATSFVSINSIVTNSSTVSQNFVTVPSGMPAGDVVFAIRTGTALLSVLIDDVVWEAIPLTAPLCSTISTPANNAVDVAISSNISWAANIDATGYFLQIGTTAGGVDILPSTDLGNVLTYNPPVDLAFSTTYFATLTAYNANGNASACAETTFTTKAAPPTGSVCSDPIVINAATLPYATTDNTNLYGNDYANGSTQCSSYYMSGDDVVYAITPASNMSVNIVLSDLSDTYSGIHVLDGCPNSVTPPNCVAFAGDTGITTRNLQSVLLTGGTTYYIVISTWASPQSTAYTLTITENSCIIPTVTFSKSNNCPTETFNAVANITNLGSGTSLTVSDDQGSSPQVVSAIGNVSFGPYAFGTNVVLTVVNNQDVSCAVTSAILTLVACPPANDECSGAFPLTVNADFSCASFTAGTVSAATASAVDGTACSGTENDDVWFSFVATATTHKIKLTDVVGSSTDLFHSLWTGADCNSLTLVPGTCSDPNTSTPAGLTLGQTYFIRVYSFYAVPATTSFNVCVGTLPPVPANDDCANAIAVTMPYNNFQDASSATNNAGFVTACGTGTNDGVWYTVVGDGGNITIDVTDVSDWDARISVYTGSCGAFTCVGTVDQSTGDETYTITGSVIGTTYYINVGHWSASTDGPEGPFTIDITTTLSSDSFDNASFMAYPNPVKDVFNLSYTSEISSVRVLNLLGQEVVSKAVNATSTQVDMSQLSAGTYIVNVTVGNSVKSIKVIKQ